MILNCIMDKNMILKISALVLCWVALVISAGTVEVDPGKSVEYQALDVVGKSPSELIRLRGFGAQKHYVITKDGYYINVVRIINPRLKSHLLKRPVVFNHGLLESSTIWLINSLGMEPLPYDNICQTSPDLTAPNGTRLSNGPMMLANNGYDVWLMSMRGTDWSHRHQYLTSKNESFWNYSLDDFALADIPAVLEYIKYKTGATKIGYIGHSQATFSIFGLLATHPHYAELVEPVIAVAPVAFFDHITSVGRPIFLATLDATDRDKHGPFPPNARRMRKLLSKICTKGFSLTSTFCQISELMVSGIGKEWLTGYFSHMPFYTSLKVLRHFGQLIRNRRFMMYDYGKEENKKIYGSEEAPSYPIEKITSKSICLISTDKDALSPPEDVKHFKEKLVVPLFRDIKIEGNFNHFDLITDKQANMLVFKPILEIMETFEFKSGICRKDVSEVEAVSNEIALDGLTDVKEKSKKLAGDNIEEVYTAT